MPECNALPPATVDWWEHWCCTGSADGLPAAWPAGGQQPAAVEVPPCPALI